MNERHIQELVLGYKVALLWSSNDVVDGEQKESLEDYELAPESLESIEKDCRAFVQANLEDLLEYAENRTYDPSQGSVWEYAGHDFWLTRVGHGVGFWDRGLGDLGDRLTAACKVFKEQWPYVGDDGLVYLV